MNKWEVETEIRMMIRKEALEKIDHVVALASRGLITFNEMIEVIEETNEMKQKAEDKLSNMIWNQA